MPIPELIHPLQALGLPVTEGATLWRHSRFYLRARTSGVRAAISLAKTEGFPMNPEALKRYDREPREPKATPFFNLDNLTPSERRTLAEMIERESGDE